MGNLYGILQSRFKSAKWRKVRALRFVGAVEDEIRSSLLILGSRCNIYGTRPDRFLWNIISFLYLLI